MANIGSLGYMKRCRWTKEQLVEGARSVKSIRQLLKQLRVIGAGGNYATVKKYLKLLDIDTSHFTNKGWRKGSTVPITPAKPLQEILVLGSEYGSYKLKRRLFAAGLKPRYCESCGWAQLAPGGRLPLELDHINGDRHDNRLENLRILCPNCHSLTPTYRALNRRK